MFLAGLFSSCESFAPPTTEQQTFMDSVNLKFKDKLTIKHVPTYDDYMHVYLKNDYNKNLIDSLENAYTQTLGFVEFLVYDKEGKLIRGSYGSM
jgi:hypothetical protein